MGACWHWAQRLIKQAPLAPTPALPQRGRECKPPPNQRDVLSKKKNQPPIPASLQRKALWDRGAGVILPQCIDENPCPPL